LAKSSRWIWTGLGSTSHQFESMSRLFFVAVGKLD
jgi:hypothetical protein